MKITHKNGAIELSRLVHHCLNDIHRNRGHFPKRLGKLMLEWKWNAGWILLLTVEYLLIIGWAVSKVKANIQKQVTAQSKTKLPNIYKLADDVQNTTLFELVSAAEKIAVAEK